MSLCQVSTTLWLNHNYVAHTERTRRLDWQRDSAGRFGHKAKPVGERNRVRFSMVLAVAMFGADRARQAATTPRMSPVTQ